MLLLEIVLNESFSFCEPLTSGSVYVVFFYRKMRNAVEEWRRDAELNGLFGEIGAFTESIFDGDAGTKLMNATASFCQHQQHALDILRERFNSLS